MSLTSRDGYGTSVSASRPSLFGNATLLSDMDPAVECAKEHGDYDSTPLVHLFRHGAALVDATVRPVACRRTVRLLRQSTTQLTSSPRLNSSSLARACDFALSLSPAISRPLDSQSPQVVLMPDFRAYARSAWRALATSSSLHASAELA